ncbi:MAG: hypothetical protein V1810_02250 [Candidatus Beckwithbacteria bacterium]
MAETLKVLRKFESQRGLVLPEFKRINQPAPVNESYLSVLMKVFDLGIKMGKFEEWSFNNTWGVLVDEDSQRGVKYERFGVKQTGIAAWYFDFPDQVALNQARLMEIIAFGKDRKDCQRAAVAQRSQKNNGLIWFFYEETESGSPLLVLSQCGSDEAGWWKIGLDKKSDFEIGFGDLQLPAQIGYGTGAYYLHDRRCPNLNNINNVFKPIEL